MEHLNKPSKELILDLINKAGQQLLLTMKDLTFGVPSANSTGGRNTQVVVSGVMIDGFGFRGQRTVRYDRLDLSVAMPPTDAQTMELAVPNDGFETKLEVVARLNKMYNLQIGADDIIDGPVDVTVLPATTTIVAKSSSLAWLGQLPITFVPDRPMYKPTFSSLVLDGLPTPEPTNAGINTPTAIPNTSPSVVNGEGNLWQPDNGMSPATNFAVSRNSEIEVAISPRVETDVPVVPQDNYSYPLVLAGANGWNVVFAISMVGTPAEDPLDKYNISFLLTGPDGTELTLTLRKVGNNYALVNTEKAINVLVFTLDGYLTNGQYIIQASLSMRNMATHLGEIIRNSAGGPLGSYTIRLMARRRNTVAPRVLAAANVRVIN